MAVTFKKIEATDRRKNSRTNFEKTNSSLKKKGHRLVFFNTISHKEKVRLYYDLATLLSSGIDLNNCYDILIGQFNPKKKIHNVIVSIQQKTKSGKNVEASFSESYTFTDFELINLRIGEEANNLIDVLFNLAKYFEAKIALKRDIIALLTYPIIIVIITVGVLYFMLSTVVPMFASVFNQFGSELPYLTRKIIEFSNNIDVVTYWFLGIIVSIVGINYYIDSKDKLKASKEKVLFRLPVIGGLYKSIAMNRFCSSMSLLLNSKINLPEALSLCSQIVNFKSFQYGIQSANELLSKGITLHSALERQQIFEKKVVSMIKVGEDTNRLDGIFLELKKQYEEDVKYKAKIIGTIIEPMIIVVIGAIVGIVMISMYAPMFDMSKILQPR